MTSLLRIVAVAIAAAALADPAFEVRRVRPLPVRIVTAPSAGDPDAQLAVQAKSALLERLGQDVRETSATPAATVLVGGAPAGAPYLAAPVSFISVAPPGVNVVAARVAAPSHALVGQRVMIRLDVAATGNVPASSAALEQGTLEISRVPLRWSADAPRATVDLPFVPLASGPHRLRVRVHAVPGEATAADNAIDFAVTASAARLRILVFEPRPSWPAAFVRRALEAHPAFTIAAATRQARGVEALAGDAPVSLSAPALTGYDAVVVGAPEELSAREVAGLAQFVEDRGGAAILLPDRPPSGAYARLLPRRAYEERLLETPARLAAHGGGALHASELLVARAPARLSVPLAEWAEARPAAIVESMPRGRGIVIFSGALDAWRFRDRDGDGFGAFWRGVVATAAAGVPPPLDIEVQPALAAPGERLVIRALLRDDAAGALHASLAGADGASPIRLWPTGTTGEFAAEVTAPVAGLYELRVSSRSGHAASTPLQVVGGVQGGRAQEVPPFVSAATGGVTVHASDTGPLERHLRGLDRPAESVTAHPMRSPWWVAPFVMALCAEWVLRRRNGLR